MSSTHHHRQQEAQHQTGTHRRQHQALIEQLEAGHSDALTNYLTAMSRFHNYSFGNVLEIARQMPTPPALPGFWTWKKLGRSVKKGEKGIRILAPIVGVKRKKDEEAEKDITTQNTRALVGFRTAYVFDVSQTNGVDLPEMREISGDPGENIDRLAAFLKSQGIQLVFTEKHCPRLGHELRRTHRHPSRTVQGRGVLARSYTKRRTRCCTRPNAAQQPQRQYAKQRPRPIAFVVGKAVGLVTGTASADYIHLYHGNASLLAESLEVIQQTAAVILAALEPLEVGDQAETTELAEVA